MPGRNWLVLITNDDVHQVQQRHGLQFVNSDVCLVDACTANLICG